MFKALLLEEADGKVSSSIQTLDEKNLPEGDVTIAVQYSTLNYKDGMILKGLGRLVRTYPHVPGVDFAGTVVESSNPAWKAGDEAILTGWRKELPTVYCASWRRMLGPESQGQDLPV